MLTIQSEMKETRKAFKTNQSKKRKKKQHSQVHLEAEFLSSLKNEINTSPFYVSGR